LDAMRGYPEEATWWIGLLLFVPEVRSKGLGQSVTDAFIEYARGQGCQSVMLGVVEENQRGIHFWESMGFEFVRQTEPRQFGEKIQAVTVLRRQLLDDQEPVL
jgi:ribosomal protein S18 acetylase RimI-like enzyme